MKTDIPSWVQSCIQCQETKVNRHIKVPLGTSANHDARFQHIHMDIAGSFPPAEDNGYLFYVQ